MLELYQNIRNRRKELGMSQEELAKKVGYTSRSTIARIESRSRQSHDNDEYLYTYLPKCKQCFEGDRQHHK